MESNEETWVPLVRAILDTWSKDGVGETDALWAASDLLFFILHRIGFNKSQALICIKNHLEQRYKNPLSTQKVEKYEMD